MMCDFKPNRNFRRKYDKLFKKDPLAANTFLLILELSNENGEVTTNPEELLSLLVARFNDPCKEYALPGGVR